MKMPFRVNKNGKHFPDYASTIAHVGTIGGIATRKSGFIQGRIL
jgi:hypothetical protein